MPYSPLTAPLWWLAGLASVAVFVTGLWLLHAGATRGSAELLAAGGLLAGFGLFGRFPVLALLARRGVRRRPIEGGTVLRVRRADGRELNVEVDGPAGASPIVLVHDWGACAAEWREVRPLLSSRFRLYMPDLPGMGQSPPRAPDGWHFEALARDLRRVVECAGPGPVVLAGQGMGGMIVLTYCRLFPRDLAHRVAGLVLAGTPHASPLECGVPGPIARLRRPLIEPVLALTVGLAPLARLLHGAAFLTGAAHVLTAWTGFAGRVSRERLDFAARFVPTADPATLARGARAMLRFDETATLRTVAIPSLVLSGDRDREASGACVQRMRHDLEGELLRMDAGHLVPLEQPERFAEALARFAGDCVGQLDPTLPA